MDRLRAILFILFWVAWIAAVSGCAQSRLYDRQGNRLASFQGDMTNVKYRSLADGSTEWSADTVDHSSATKAQGEAAAGKLSAGGAAIAVSGLTALFR